ncbi:hypothetical protein GCM10027436_65220 [Actinophytocola sediminis]
MSAQGATYLHTAQDPDDHPVVPRPAPPDWAGGRCDFCNDESPTFVLPVRDFVAPNVPGDVTGWDYSQGGWAACTRCAPLIDANRWNALERRWAAAFQQHHGIPPSADAATATRALLRTLRTNISGSLTPINRGET